MSELQQGVITRKVRETEDAVSLYIKVDKTLDYHPGQFITIQIPYEGRVIQRSYSLSSHPMDQELRITIKKIKKGLGSGILCDEVMEGDVIEFKGPEGVFTLEDNPGPRVFIGAGSGITPLFSMIKESLKSTNEPHFLFYGNKKEEDVIFAQEINALAEKYAHFDVIHFYSKKGFLNKLLGKKGTGQSGRIRPEYIQSYLTEQSTELSKASYYICGPQSMNEDTRRALIEYGTPESNIKVEFYASSGSSDQEGVVSEVTALLIDDEATISIEPGKNILESLIDAGYDPPHSCTSGACCTCIALLKSGEVSMERTDALSKSEIKKGFILTCQACPTTPEVTVDYNIYDS